MSDIRKNLEILWDRIGEAALRSGRRPDSVVLVAAAKGMDAERVEEAIACGITIIGENRVQEAEEKKSGVSLQAEWHMIGHLQTNKVKRALELFTTIQSVDSLRLARAVDARAGSIDRRVDVLVEVNTSGEPSKFGVEPGRLLEFMDSLNELPRLNVRGLMTVGRFAGEADEVRPCFRLLRDLARRCADRFGEKADVGVLSMGMTQDFETAIEEGSTMVRIGTAVFGPRGQ